MAELSAKWLLNYHGCCSSYFLFIQQLVMNYLLPSFLITLISRQNTYRYAAYKPDINHDFFKSILTSNFLRLKIALVCVLQANIWANMIGSYDHGLVFELYWSIWQDSNVSWV